MDVSDFSGGGNLNNIIKNSMCKNGTLCVLTHQINMMFVDQLMQLNIIDEIRQ